MIIAKTKMIAINILCFLAGMAVAMVFTKLLKWGVVFVFLAVAVAAGLWWAKRVFFKRKSIEHPTTF